jgi:hypothetical protein
MNTQSFDTLKLNKYYSNSYKNHLDFLLNISDINYIWSMLGLYFAATMDKEYYRWMDFSPLRFNETTTSYSRTFIEILGLDFT